MPKIDDKIAGISIGRIRQLFRTNIPIGFDGTRWFGAKYIQEKFHLSEGKARAMIRRLQQLGYLGNEPDENDCYGSTEKGKFFGMEKGNRPISCDKADALYAGFLERIKLVNENDDFLIKISGFYLFGNYVTGRPITNIEILLIVEEKDPDTFREKRKLKVLAHKSYLGIDKRTTIAHQEIRQFLRAKSPYLTIYFHWNRTKWVIPEAQRFDEFGNHLESNTVRKKAPKKANKSKADNGQKSNALVGRLLFNERKGKNSKNKLTRRHVENVQQLDNFHDQVLNGLTAILRAKFKDCIVSPECLKIGLGTRIDIVRKTKKE